ncbi:MAG TPA: glycosyltransferase family 2 protein [Solirubrobacteraceae bacterium]|nr:glycosyltransferase family 2 protein [Solirubrobacteraceae bacterium]
MAQAQPVSPTPVRELGLLSVVAPMCNEEGIVEPFYARVCAALADLPFELIVIDDGSVDGTAERLARLAEDDRRLRVLTLSRNFGHQTAITAGLDHASGDAVVMIDGDMQDPPELIHEMLDHWRRGSDVVYAVREQRQGETRFKLVTADWFYRLFARISKIDLQPNSGDFRLMDKAALMGLRSMRERNRFLRGMTVWVGFNQSAVGYVREPRPEGETKYTLRRMLRFSLDAVASFSHLPLQLATLLGFVFSIAAFVALPLVVLARVFKVYVPGVSSILFVVLLLGGIQLITVGIIGEYVGRIYDEVKRRPLYLVKTRRNFPDAASDAADQVDQERIGTF